MFITKQKLVISSVPTGATVFLDNKLIGTTPLEVVIAPEGFDDFMALCFHNSSVICSKDFLHPYLTNKSVARYWPYLSKEQRISLGTFIISKFATFQIPEIGDGDHNCKGNVTNWRRAYCLAHALIRFSRMNFAEPYPELGMCYYNDIHGNIYCYIDVAGVEAYHLPCQLVSIVGIGHLYGHGICGLQVGEDETEFSSWLFFQYTEIDIKPGSWQMPYDSRININHCMHGYADCGGINIDKYIAKWIIDKDGNIEKVKI